VGGGKWDGHWQFETTDAGFRNAGGSGDSGCRLPSSIKVAIRSR
jgi:hypothetical protein